MPTDSNFVWPSLQMRMELAFRELSNFQILTDFLDHSYFRLQYKLIFALLGISNVKNLIIFTNTKECEFKNRWMRSFWSTGQDLCHIVWVRECSEVWCFVTHPSLWWWRRGQTKTLPCRARCRPPSEPRRSSSCPVLWAGRKTCLAARGQDSIPHCGGGIRGCTLSLRIGKIKDVKIPTLYWFVKLLSEKFQ